MQSEKVHYITQLHQGEKPYDDLAFYTWCGRLYSGMKLDEKVTSLPLTDRPTTIVARTENDSHFNGQIYKGQDVVLVDKDGVRFKVMAWTICRRLGQRQVWQDMMRKYVPSTYSADTYTLYIQVIEDEAT